MTTRRSPTATDLFNAPITFVFLFLISGCATDEGGLPKPSNTVNPQTLNVTTALSGSSVQVEINPTSGGSIELTDTKGNAYRLDIPDFALPGNEPLSITVTAIEEMVVGTQGVSFLAGIRIEPAIKLLVPASLAITVTNAVQNEVIGFRKTGSQSFFLPLSTNSNTQGFISLLEFGDVAGLEFFPGTGCTENALSSIYLARQELGCLKAILGEDFFDEDGLLENFANRWADFTISSLQSATSISDIFRAASNYNQWYLEGSFVDASTAFPDKVQTIHDLAEEKIALARNELNVKCLMENSEAVQYQFQQLRKLAGRTNSSRFPIFDLVDLETANFCQ
ncbi:MAG: hypothetical protein ACR2MX_00020 [Cyclobacteriaceae bacterium]